jgi:D-aminopeptidase
MTVRMLANDAISPLFDATVLATEEAIVNAMVAATDMTGDRGRVAKAIDHEQLRSVLRLYNRLAE